MSLALEKFALSSEFGRGSLQVCWVSGWGASSRSHSVDRLGFRVAGFWDG